VVQLSGRETLVRARRILESIAVYRPGDYHHLFKLVWTMIVRQRFFDCFQLLVGIVDD
jgi:hypothetical protein